MDSPDNSHREEELLKLDHIKQYVKDKLILSSSPTGQSPGGKIITYSRDTT